MVQSVKSYLFFLFFLSYTITSSSQTNEKAIPCFCVKELKNVKDKLQITKFDIQNNKLCQKTYFQSNNNLSTQLVDLENLIYIRFYIFSAIWGSQITPKIEHMTGVNQLLLTELEIKVNKLRNNLMYGFSNQLFVDKKIFMERVNLYFPHNFANFSNIYEGWDTDNTTTTPCDKPGNWFGHGRGEPCNNAYRTQVRELKDKGLIKMDLATVKKHLTPIIIGNRNITLFNQNPELSRQRISAFVTNFAAKAITNIQSEINLTMDEEIMLITHIKAKAKAHVEKQWEIEQKKLRLHNKGKQDIISFKINISLSLYYAKLLLTIKHFIVNNEKIAIQPIKEHGKDVEQMSVEIGSGIGLQVFSQ